MSWSARAFHVRMERAGSRKTKTLLTADAQRNRLLEAISAKRVRRASSPGVFSSPIIGTCASHFKGNEQQSLRRCTLSSSETTLSRPAFFCPLGNHIKKGYDCQREFWYRWVETGAKSCFRLFLEDEQQRGTLKRTPMVYC